MDRRSLLKALALTPVASVAFPAFASDALKPASAPVWNSEHVNALAVRVDREDAPQTREVALGPQGSEDRPL